MIMLFNDCPEAESWSSPCWRLLGEVLLVGQALLKDPPASKVKQVGKNVKKCETKIEKMVEGSSCSKSQASWKKIAKNVKPKQ